MRSFLITYRDSVVNISVWNNPVEDYGGQMHQKLQTLQNILSKRYLRARGKEVSIPNYMAT